MIVIIWLAILFVLSVFIAPALWCALETPLKIENLTYKKAFLTSVLLTLTGGIMALIHLGLSHANVKYMFIDLLLLAALFVFAIALFKTRLKTTVLKSTGLCVSTLVLVLFLALVLRLSVVKAYVIPAGSMLDTLQIGDRILVDKFYYGVKHPVSQKILIPVNPPERGDLAVFVYPIDKRDFIKRIVAVAADTIEIRDTKVYINGEWDGKQTYERFADYHHYDRVIPKDKFEHMWLDILDRFNEITAQPEIFSDLEYDPPDHDLRRFIFGNFRDNFGPVTVPADHVFVLGDNRDNSHDSRFWGFVSCDALKGKAFSIYWSWDRQNEAVRWDRIGKSL